MFFTAKLQQISKFFFKAIALLAVILGLAVMHTRVQASSSPEIAGSTVLSEQQQSDTLHELTLNYQCQDNSQQKWTVTNANSFEMAYEWFLSTGESGSSIVPSEGTDSFLTSNSIQTVTIRYTFPQKEVCGDDEKCGESEIIKLSVTSEICEIAPQEPLSSDNLAESIIEEEQTQVIGYSHQVKQSQGVNTISQQALSEVFLKGNPFQTMKDVQKWGFTRLLCQPVVHIPEIS